MKKTLLSLFALAATLTASAEPAMLLTTDAKAGYSSVQISTVNGENTTVTLSDEMTTTFTAQDIVFADGTTTVSIPLAQLRTYTFVPATPPDGITEVPVLQNGVTAIFSADGRQLPTLDGAPAGMYIVKCGKTTMKIYRK